MAEQQAHLVFLRSGRLLLVKRPDLDWRKLQEEYEEYMASLGPWAESEIIEHFSFDYSEDDSTWPLKRNDIKAFFEDSTQQILSSL